MSVFNYDDDDELRYEDDDDYSSDDEEILPRYADDDDEDEESSSSSIRSNINPFNRPASPLTGSGSGLPGSSRLGGSGAAGSPGTGRGPSSPLPGRSGTGPLGGSSNRPPTYSSGGSGGAFGGGEKPAPPPGFRGGSGSSGASGSSSSSSTRTIGSPGGGGSSPASSSRPGFGGGSGTPGSSPRAPFGASPEEKKDDKKDEKKGGLLGGLLGGRKGDDKESKSAASASAFGARGGTGPLGGRKPGDDKAGEKKGGLLSGVTSKLPFGKKSDDKENKPAAAGGAFSARGGTGPLGQRKPDAKEGEKGGGFGGMFGSIKSRFGGGGDKAPKDAKASPKSPGGDAGKGGGLFSNRTAGGAAPAGDSLRGGRPGASGAAAAKADAPAGGGFFGRLFRRGEPAAAGAAAKKPRPSRVPTVAEEEGLSLDNWLDIIGVALVFGGLVYFMSALSAEQAAIAAVHRFFGQLLGWGAWSVPLVMLGVGGWLIWRHFGDQAPTVDPVRVGGLVVLYLTLLVVMQYIDSLTYQGVTSMELLRLRLDFAWRVHQSGGGAVGAELYYALITGVTEIGGVFVLLFTLMIGGMLLTRSTASEIVAFIVSLWRNMRDGMQQRAEIRRAQRQLAVQQAALRQPQPEISISRPEPPALPGMIPNALPAPAMAELPIEQRDILIRKGGQTLLGPQPEAAMTVDPRYAAAPQPAQPASSSGGLLGRFRPGGGKPDASAPAAPAPEPARSGGSGTGLGTVAAALTGGLLGRRSAAPEPPTPPKVDLPETPLLPYDDLPPVLPPASVPPARSPEMPAPASPFGAPAAPAASAPTPQPYTPPSPASASSTPAPQPFAPAASAAPPNAAPSMPPAAEHPAAADPQQARLDRLNQIRSGQTSAPTPAPASPPAAETSAPRFSAFGRPEDRIVHPSEKRPFEDGSHVVAGSPPRTPVAPPAASTEAYQQALFEPLQVAPPAKPVSSGLQSTRQRRQWKLPDARTLLASGSEQEFDKDRLIKQAKTIEETLSSFGAPGRVVEVNTGPVITQFGVEPDYLMIRGGKKQRVKVGAIAALDKDLQLALGARSIRVEAPVPGKGYVGIEVPNEESSLVSLRDVMEADSFRRIKSPLAIALGQSVSGAPISADLSVMPHLLIAGTTGSGKSVCVNSIIASLIIRNTPDIVKFIMVDPKRVELTGYNGIPHLVAPVVVELERIVGVLKWVTREMDDRYKRFSDAGARNIVDYNKHLNPDQEPMPFIIVIIDELADLMMLAPEETERTITRIAALARATGIHLVIATQRPSVDVVTGLIKANFPARIAFAVAGGVDSRVILDQPGAERLLGKGDMLYMSGDSPAPLRLQGVFVSDMEINNIVRYWKMQAIDEPAPRPISFASEAPAEPAKEVMPRGERVRQAAFWEGGASARKVDFDEMDEDDEGGDDLSGMADSDDDLYEKAVELVRRLDKASVSLLQRRLRIGYTRAARLVDMMEARGVVGPAKEGSSKPRDVLPQR